MIIDLAEPHAAAHVGDRVPCHLFMPEVAWHEPFPVLRPRPRREVWLQSREPWAIEPSTDMLEPHPAYRLVGYAVGAAVCCALAFGIADMLGLW